MRRVFLAFAVTAASSLLGCGGRTPLLVSARRSDAAVPEAGPEPDASSPSCVPAPAGGHAIGSFPQSAITLALAVSGSMVYVGTTAISTTSPLYVGALFDVPSAGGATHTLAASDLNFGNLASDGTLLYYPQTSGKPTGPNGAIYETLGLASIDLASGAVHPIATSAPPRSTSSILDSYMIAASSAWPGVFWVGAPSGAANATSLSAWNRAGDTVTTIATGSALRGLAVDASFVYWADTGDGQGVTVYKRPLAGGRTSVVATVPGGTYGQLLGVSSASVVFVSDYATGTIMTASKTGGPAKLLVTAASSWVNDSAWVDGNYLYWVENADQTTLKRISVAGGPTEVVPTQGLVQSLAFDACNIYIGSTSPPQVFVRPK
jgi:hypothetical protein